jgi:hypothetical protein
MFPCGLDHRAWGSALTGPISKLARNRAEVDAVVSLGAIRSRMSGVGEGHRSLATDRQATDRYGNHRDHPAKPAKSRPTFWAGNNGLASKARCAVARETRPTQIAERGAPGTLPIRRGADVASAIGISISSVLRIRWARGLQPHRVRQFKWSNDPQFPHIVRRTRYPSNEERSVAITSSNG